MPPHRLLSSVHGGELRATTEVRKGIGEILIPAFVKKFKLGMVVFVRFVGFQILGLYKSIM